MRSKFVYDREKEHRKSKEKNLTGTVTDALPAQKMPSAYTIKELQLTIGHMVRTLSADIRYFSYVTS